MWGILHQTTKQNTLTEVLALRQAGEEEVEEVEVTSIEMI
jgi:hypothetical protein